MLVGVAAMVAVGIAAVPRLVRDARTARTIGRFWLASLRGLLRCHEKNAHDQQVQVVVGCLCTRR
ncbi:uncharacterized protein DS421_18g617580 [Arachis hypogaea]|nr:uncharacterized protein DS421_18g617580 [Arachis hypogaea]